MSDEIKFGFYETGNDNIYADVLEPDGSDRDVGIHLLDDGHLGLYMGDSTEAQAGDIVRIEDTGASEILAVDVWQPESTANTNINSIRGSEEAAEMVRSKALEY